MRVMVAMSGGVDSSVAAAMMVEAGHEVVGLTMKLRDASSAELARRGGSCCSPDDLMDARQVCDHLGIAHYVVDYREVFRRQVMEPFAEDYLAGRTPNPCVRCNDHVKFAPLLERARALGAERLVTGHYARVVESGGRFALHQAADLDKDQSYFLFGVPGEALAMTWFPLGELDKTQVRAHARALGLPTWDKADSEDICFVPEGNYQPVVERLVGPDRVPGPGPVVDEEGRQLGEHGGVHRFTVGQRKGLGLGGGDRLYVLSVDGPTRTVVVGPADHLQAGGLVARRLRWLAGEAPAEPVRARVRIRYRHGGAEASAEMAGSDELRIRFDEPQRAVTPGQAVVLYRGTQVLGGGWIDSALPVEGA